MRIHHQIETLSDGSEVSNVVLEQYGQQIELRAITERDATALINILREAILVHTVDNVTVAW